MCRRASCLAFLINKKNEDSPMKKIIILFLSIVFCSSVYADIAIVTGSNVAKFRNENTDINIGYTIGILKKSEFTQLKEFNFEYGFVVTKLTANLFNKYLFFNEYPDKIYPLKILYKVFSLKIPMIWNYEKNVKTNAKLICGIGCSLNLAFKNKSVTKNGIGKNRDNIANENIYRYYNDISNFSTLLENSGISTLLDLGYQYKNIGIRVLYDFSLQRTFTVNSVKIKEKLEVYSLILVFTL